MKNSTIEWTDHTVNLWWGCSKVHTGCKNCYAETLSNRFNNGKNSIWGDKSKRKAIKSAFKDLDKYQKQALKDNTKQKVFVGSMMDIFEDSKTLINPQWEFSTTNQLRIEFFERISSGRYPNLIFLLLTKRPENIEKFAGKYFKQQSTFMGWKNVWFGTSISNESSCNLSDKLGSVPFIDNKFLSIEPQVEFIPPLKINPIDNGIKWIIQGGESGPKKRPFKIHWAYFMKEYCEKNKIAYFFKQIDKKQSIPEDLKIRQFPKFK